LIKHGIEALRASAQDTDLTEHNVSIGVVSKDEPFRQLSKDELRAIISGNGNGDVEMIQQ
jgi:20S proteasome alpha/beta subunit